MRSTFSVAGLTFKAQWSPRGLHAVRIVNRKPANRRISVHPPQGGKPDLRPRNKILRDEMKRTLFGKPSRKKIPLDWNGATEFQKKVWRELQKIPPGQTRSYTDIARRIGRPRAARAVGAACGANPIIVLVPCHRVIASDGSLGGFSCGLALKKKLLAMESRKWGRFTTCPRI